MNLSESKIQKEVRKKAGKLNSQNGVFKKWDIPYLDFRSSGHTLWSRQVPSMCSLCLSNKLFLALLFGAQGLHHKVSRLSDHSKPPRYPKPSVFIILIQNNYRITHIFHSISPIQIMANWITIYKHHASRSIRLTVEHCTIWPYLKAFQPSLAWLEWSSHPASQQ